RRPGSSRVSPRSERYSGRRPRKGWSRGSKDRSTRSRRVPAEGPRSSLPAPRLDKAFEIEKQEASFVDLHQYGSVSIRYRIEAGQSTICNGVKLGPGLIDRTPRILFGEAIGLLYDTQRVG